MTDVKKIHLDLLENGLDFVLSSLDPIVNSTEEKQLKYSILHLSAGVELILKERLKIEHWSLIFENVNKANDEDFKSGDFQTVNLEIAITRLENICGIILSEEDKRNLKELRKRRNKIEHFSVQEIDKSIKSIVSKVLSTTFTFIQNQFDENKLEENTLRQIELLRIKVFNFAEFNQLRTAQIKESIDYYKDDHHIIQCPKCFQETMILMEPTECLFCGYFDTPEKITKSYIDTVLGINLMNSPGHEADFPLTKCPSCSGNTLVISGDERICFSCKSVWDKAALNKCADCENLYFPYDDNGEKCPNCNNKKTTANSKQA